MKWVELKELGQNQLESSRSFQDYMRYRRIPEEVASRYELGVIKLSQLRTLDILPEDLRKKLEDDRGGNDWLMVPLEDIGGNPLGVELRQKASKSFFKVFFPESRVHPVLFGVRQALDNIVEYRSVAIVEGVFDLLTFATVTKYPAVAWLTKTPSARQLRWIRRWTDRVTLFLDSDDEGQSAARSLSAFQRPGTLIVNSQWWEMPTVNLGKLKDLNEVARQQGWSSVRSILEFGLKK